MKRTFIYVAVITALLVLAQTAHWQFVDSLSPLSGNGYNGSVSIERDKVELLQLWATMAASMENRDTSKFEVSQGDSYLICNFSESESTIFVVLADSPISEYAVQVYQDTIKTSFCENSSIEMNFRAKITQYVRDKIEIEKDTLTKKSLLKKIRDADYVSAAIGHYPFETRSFVEKLFTFPLLVPLLVVFAFVIIWITDKLSLFLEVLLSQPRKMILGGTLTFVMLFEIWRIVNIHLARLADVNQVWSAYLTAYVFAGLTIIPLFFLFFYLKKNYFKQLNFADEEAAKFVYIFLTIVSYNVVCSYFDAKLYNSIGEGRMGTVMWWSVQIPGFALLFATGNFLNNFRQHYFSLKGKEVELKTAQKNELNAQSQLAALQSRVNPHFLYNSLNAIASLAIENPKKTEQMTLALSKFYKYSTNRTDENWTTVAKELELINTYLEIERIRFGDTLEVDLLSDESLVDFQIPHFLLQPLVENGIKYGYDTHSDKIKVSVIVEEVGRNVSIKVLDSGPPFEESMELGYGLKSVQQKLKLLYPDQHQLDFTNLPEKGVFITILKK